MTDDVRIRITQRSIGSGESTIPTTGAEFEDWLSQLEQDRPDVRSAEVVVELPDDASVRDVVPFLETLAAADDWDVTVSELTVTVEFLRN